MILGVSDIDSNLEMRQLTGHCRGLRHQSQAWAGMSLCPPRILTPGSPLASLLHAPLQHPRTRCTMETQMIASFATAPSPRAGLSCMADPRSEERRVGK